MNVYADTSWWLAFNCQGDALHDAAAILFEHHPDAQVLWTPWQRVEVFNSFHQAERLSLVGAGEAKRLVRLIEDEVRLGYWPHREFNWTSAVRIACAISSTHGSALPIRAMDLFHVAIAIDVQAHSFLSFDNDQNLLAAAAGLKLLRLSLPAR